MSVVLFSLGLSIYLYDIHIGVAAPVITITALSAIFYVAATVLPLVDEHCPLKTPLHIIFQKASNTSRNQCPKDVTGRILNWIIASCEEPSSVDIALQAIAGADFNRQMLHGCNAAQLISQRLRECLSSSEHGNKDKLVDDPSLLNTVLSYIGALSFLDPGHVVDPEFVWNRRESVSTQNRPKSFSVGDGIRSMLPPT
jgi:hypothetical protein